MGFRNPLTSAVAVDTGQPTGAGARVYQGSDATGVYGVLEFRDGIAGDLPVTITGRANLVPQGGGAYTQQGGGLKIKAGSFNGVTAPDLGLLVEADPAGGYRSAYRIAADLIVLDGEFSGPDPWTAYTPAWTAAGGTPNFGTTGGLSGRYRMLPGRVCEVDIDLGLNGSGINGGSGPWTFTLPLPAAAGREQYLALKTFTSAGWLLGGFGLILGGSNVLPYSPISPTNGDHKRVQEADVAAAGTGIPLVPGNYPFLAGHNLKLYGRYETVS